MSIPRDFRPPPTGAETPIVPWRLNPRVVLGVGLGAWIASYALAQITVSDVGIPALFLPTGVGVGLLLRLPGRMWWWVLGAMLATDVGGGTVLGLATFEVAAIWGVSNAVQVLALAFLLRRAKVDMSRPRDPVVLATVAAVVTAIVAVVGSLSLASVSDVDATQFWADWWGSDVLSVVLVVPLILLLGRASPPRGRRALEALAWFVVALAGLLVQFAGFVYPALPVWVWLIVATPLVVLYSLRFGLLAMSLFLLGMDWIAASLTAWGVGPFQELALGDGTPMRTLQLVLLVIAVSVQSVSLMVSRSLRHSTMMAGQQALLDAILEESPIATALLAPDCLQITRTNRAFRELLADTGPSDLPTYFPASERDAVTQFLKDACPTRETRTGEFSAVDPSGDPLQVRLRVVAVAADDFDRYGTLRSGANVARLVLAEDMTDVRRRESRLRHEAVTDPLTGLANRRQLVHVLEATLPAASPTSVVSLSYIDLDGFKDVNDRFGHAVGDQVLRHVGQRLSQTVGADELAARSGGDEFVIITSGLADRSEAQVRAEHLLEALLNDPEVSWAVGASVGVALTTDPAQTAEALLQRGDRLMYAAKESGGSCVIVDH